MDEKNMNKWDYEAALFSDIWQRKPKENIFIVGALKDKIFKVCGLKCIIFYINVWSNL